MEYILFGHLFPSFKGVQFGITNPPFKLQVQSALGDFELTLLLNRTYDIIVRVETQKEIADISTLVEIVHFQIQSLYDTAMLISGVLNTVVITSVVLPDKSLRAFNPYDISDWLNRNIFDFKVEDLFGLQNDPKAKLATSDIKIACVESHLTAHFSFRAIEGIRDAFSTGNEEDRTNAWLQMRESLNLSRDFFENVSTLATLNRHGKPTNQTFEDRKECIYSAMIVLQRYFHFIKAGRRKLDISLFPVLKSVKDFSSSL